MSSRTKHCPLHASIAQSPKQQVPEQSGSMVHYQGIIGKAKQMDEKLMNKQTVALIALFAGWIPAAGVANATTYEDIAGQWCGDVTDYVFTPDTLTVKFHDGRPDNVFKIT